jgi:DNA-binding transcriptional MerR regulator/methylmalonyl-CoA mutase cobalamin-binding subunit
MQETSYTIAAVERDVGLSKDVLRVWERRYGFPLPRRDAHGERVYPADQVQRLRLIKRLMDQGHRPGRLLAATPEELEATLSTCRGSRSAAADPALQQGVLELVDLIRAHDAAAYQVALQQRLARQGLRHFVQDTIAPAGVLIGQAWERGELQVFEEHLFTEITARALRQALATIPAGDGPRVLLTTLPNEPHGLGLLMAEVLLALEGAQCVALGTQTPIAEIAHAAQAYRVDVVALSFSAAFPQRQAPSLLQHLRATLPEPVQLWAGGAGTATLRPQPGIVAMPSLDDALAALRDWREQRAPAGT